MFFYFSCVIIYDMKITQEIKSLELKNKGGLSVFFVGVGSAFSKIHYQTNILIVKGEDHLLIDCGTMCPYALWNYGSSVVNIKNIFITHSHADHIGGLEEISLMGRYVSKQKAQMVITDEYKKLLWNQSLKGGNAYSEKHNGHYLTFDDYFNQIKPKLITKKPRPLYEATVGSLNLKIFRTMHIPEQASSWKDSCYSFGVLVDERILFPGDTRFDPDLLNWLVEKYPTIEYIYHDCQFYPGGVHTFYDELKSLPEKIRKMIYLCHYGDNFACKNPEEDGFAGYTQQGVFYNFDE